MFCQWCSGIWVAGAIKFIFVKRSSVVGRQCRGRASTVTFVCVIELLGLLFRALVLLEGLQKKQTDLIGWFVLIGRAGISFLRCLRTCSENILRCQTRQGQELGGIFAAPWPPEGCTKRLGGHGSLSWIASKWQGVACGMWQESRKIFGVQRTHSFTLLRTLLRNAQLCYPTLRVTADKTHLLPWWESAGNTRRPGHWGVRNFQWGRLFTHVDIELLECISHVERSCWRKDGSRKRQHGDKLFPSQIVQKFHLQRLKYVYPLYPLNPFCPFCPFFEVEVKTDVNSINPTQCVFFVEGA